MIPLRRKTGNAFVWLLTLMLVLTAVPAFAEEAAADTSVRSYEVDFKVLKAETDEKSAADEYVQKPAKITVEDGVGFAEITLLKSSWITAFEIEQEGELQAADVVSEDASADTRTVKFALSDIREKLTARIAVEVAAMNYQGDYTVQLQFDTSGMPGRPEQPSAVATNEEAEAEEPAVDNDTTATNEEEAAQPVVGPGEVGLSVLKDGTEEPSSLANYMSKTGQLYEREGVLYLIFTLQGSSMIPTFQYEVNGELTDAIVYSEDEEADSRTLAIPVADVSEKLTVALEVNAGPRGVMQHQAQILIQALATDTEESAEEPTEAGTEEAPAFADTVGHWAQAAIEQAAARGIVAGQADDVFNPNGKVTRAQFAVILTKALGLNREVEVKSFADQADIPAYAAEAVAQVQAAGLLGGYEDETFRPNEAVSRAQLAAIIVRTAKLNVVSNADTATAFRDGASIPVWAQPSVAAAVEAGLLAGREDGTFGPLEEATRAEVVTLVLKVLAAK